jgi:multiple sugar transport system permease protein
LTATTAEPAAAQAPAARPGRTGNQRSERRLAFLLIAPAVLLMLAVTAYPIGYAVWLSLQKANLATPGDTSFVGLAN